MRSGSSASDAVCEYHTAKKEILHKLVDGLAHLSIHL